uniref:Uncharacterized protein n=1 Tax=viral metagenome TaxID=1070528 RepID=A0A6M3XUN7_9ZZZZ
MPAPPHTKEPQQAFIERCMSYLIEKESKTKDQAVGQCLTMWRNRSKNNAKAKKLSRKVR